MSRKSHTLDDVQFGKSSSLARITLNRPGSLNALSLSMVRDLLTILSACASDSRVQHVLIESSNNKAFCAGGDIRFLYDACHAGKEKNYAFLQDFFTTEYTVNHLIHHYPKPYIALLDGVVMGGGMGIVQSSSPLRLRVATERTRMAMPEVNIGLFPDVGGSYFLSRMPGETGTWLALTGETINAADAIYANLADVLVPALSLPTLRTELSTLNVDPLQQIRQLVDSCNAEIPLLPSQFMKHRERIDYHFSQDSVPAILNSLDNDTHPFARQTAANIRRRSPLMLCVTLAQLRQGRTMTIAECLRMERTMMHHCFQHPDALEGIRAAIIDKDNQPQWRPTSLEDVTDEMVARFFEPVWAEDAHPLRHLL